MTDNIIMNCDICKKQFRSVGLLHRHQRLVHGREIVDKDATIKSGIVDRADRVLPPEDNVFDHRFDTSFIDDPQSREDVHNLWRIMMNHYVISVKGLSCRFSFFYERDYNRDETKQLLESVFQVVQMRAKWNVGFAFLCYNVKNPDQYRLMYTSITDPLLDDFYLVQCYEDFCEFRNLVINLDMMETLGDELEETKWVIERITTMAVYVNLLPGLYVLH